MEQGHSLSDRLKEAMTLGTARAPWRQTLSTCATSLVFAKADSYPGGDVQSCPRAKPPLCGSKDSGHRPSCNGRDVRITVIHSGSVQEAEQIPATIAECAESAEWQEEPQSNSGNNFAGVLRCAGMAGACIMLCMTEPLRF